MQYLDLSNLTGSDDIQAAIAAAKIMGQMYFPDDSEMQKSYATISLTAMVVRKAKYENFSQSKLPSLLSKFISPFGGFGQLLNSPSYEDMARLAEKKRGEALFAGQILHGLSQLNSINPDIEMNQRMSVNKMIYLINKKSLDRVKKLEDDLKSEEARRREEVKLIEDGFAHKARQAPKKKLNIVRRPNLNYETATNIKSESREVLEQKQSLDSKKIIAEEKQAHIKEMLEFEKKFILSDRSIEGYWSKYKTVSHLWAASIDLHNAHGGDGRWGGIDLLTVPSYHELYDLLSDAFHYQEFGQAYCPRQQGQPIFSDANLWLVPEKLPKPPAESPPPENNEWVMNQGSPIQVDPDQFKKSATKWLLELFADYRRNI
jgi:hypothetical protein